MAYYTPEQKKALEQGLIRPVVNQQQQQQNSGLHEIGQALEKLAPVTYLKPVLNNAINYADENRGLHGIAAQYGNQLARVGNAASTLYDQANYGLNRVLYGKQAGKQAVGQAQNIQTQPATQAQISVTKPQTNLTNQQTAYIPDAEQNAASPMDYEGKLIQLIKQIQADYTPGTSGLTPLQQRELQSQNDLSSMNNQSDNYKIARMASIAGDENYSEEFKQSMINALFGGNGLQQVPQQNYGLSNVAELYQRQAEPQIGLATERTPLLDDNGQPTGEYTEIQRPFSKRAVAKNPLAFLPSLGVNTQQSQDMKEYQALKAKYQNNPKALQALDAYAKQKGLI